MSKKKKPTAAKPKNPYIERDYDVIHQVHINVRNVRSVWHKRRIVLKYARACLEILKQNIRTNKNRTWKRVQWGLRKGQLALQGTEDQWIIDSPPGSANASIHPIECKRPMWRGHISGCTIRPKKAGGWLRFILDDGSRWKLKSVKLPQRDPRPTATQLRYLDRSI